MASRSVTISQLWQEAVATYTTKTGHHDAMASGPGGPLSSLSTAEDLRIYLRSRGDNFEKINEKHGRFFSIISQTVQPLINISRLAEGAFSLTPFAPVSAFLGALRYLLETSAGASAALGQVEALLEKLHSFTQRLELYTSLGDAEAAIEAALQGHVVKIFACLLDVLAQTECVVKDGRFKKWGKALFAGGDQELTELLGRLESLINEEQSIVLAIISSQSRKTVEDLNKVSKGLKENAIAASRMCTSMADMTTTIQSLRVERQANRQKIAINDHLKTDAVRKTLERHAQHCESILESTGEWLLTDQIFQKWISRDMPFLWVTGGPGTGKSCLAAITMTALRTTYARNESSALNGSSVSIAAFYVKEDDQELRSLENILKTVAHQIAQTDTAFGSHALAVLSRAENIATPRRLWETLFVDFFIKSDTPNSAMVILDGLDELDDKSLHDLFFLLGDISLSTIQTGCQDTSPRPRLCFALFGRPNIGDKFGPRLSGGGEASLGTIEIGDRNRRDIDLYVRTALSQILVVRRAQRDRNQSFAKHLALKIRRKIMDRADNMFFKVVLMLDMIRDRERVETVLEAIETMPPKLEAMISKVFRPLMVNEDVGQQDFLELLRWVCFAKKPLALAELYSALRMRTGRPYDALESRLSGAFATLFSLRFNDKFAGLDFGSDQPWQHGDSFENKNININGLTFDDDSSVSSTDGLDLDEFEDVPLNEETVARLWSTTVSFRHISIRDFLVKPKPMNSGDIGDIHLDADAAHLRIFRVCVETILQHGGRESGCNLYAYTLMMLSEHLMSMQISSLSLDDRRQVITQICQVFFNDLGASRLINMITGQRPLALAPLFRKTDFVDCVRLRWFPTAERRDFSDEEWRWITDTITSRQEFFAPLARVASRKLLSKSGHNDPAYLDDRSLMYLVYIPYFTMKMGSDEGVDWAQFGTIAEGRPPCCSIATLEKALSVYDGGVTTHWHTAYGIVLMNNRQHEAAQEQFLAAIELDPNSWRAMKGLAGCYMCKSMHGEAEAIIQRAMQCVPTDLPSASESLTAQLMTIAISRRKPSEAIKYAGNAARDWPAGSPSFSGARHLIRALYMMGDYPAIRDLWGRVNLHFAATGRPEDKPINHFINLRGIHDELGRALYAQGALSLIRPSIDTFIESPSFWPVMANQPWEPAYLGEFIYRYYNDVDPAIPLFERLLDPAYRNTALPEMEWAFRWPATMSLTYLACIYYQKAVARARAEYDAEEWLKKLSGLKSALEGLWPEQSTGFNETNMLRLGIFHRLYGNKRNTLVEKDDEIWRGFLRPTILQAVAKLEDNDSSDDCYAYSALTVYLLAAGDVANASAATAPLFLRLGFAKDASRDDEGAKKAVEVLETLDFPERWWCCDGCVTRFYDYSPPENYEELYFCMECPNLCFCGKCFERLRRGELGFLHCDATAHQYTRLFPVPEEAKDVAARFDGAKVATQENWLAAIREEWKERARVMPTEDILGPQEKLG